MKPHTTHPAGQLSDEAVADLLAHTGSVAEEHAPAEIAAVRSALQSYRAETLQWAERRSSTQASLLPAARRSARWAALPQWSMAMVAAVTIAAGVAHLAGNRTAVQDAAQQTSAAATTPAPAAEIADDNRLLTSIDAALSYHADSPVDALQQQQDERGTGSSGAAGVTD